MRLKRHGDILRVFRNGRVETGTCLALHVLPSDAGPRLGIVVSRRYGSAVERNLAKRRIREAFRRCARELPKVDIVVRPQAGCRESTVDALERLLRDSVRQSMNREGRS
jgi:ribonuclease P protein component